MKEKAQKKLFSLWTGELSAAVLFPILWMIYIPTFDWSNHYLTTFPHIFVFCILEYILLQGSLYWCLKWKQVKQGKSSSLTDKHLARFRFFKVSNLVLIMIGIPVLVYQTTFSKGLYWYLFLYGFAIIEHINYYHIRLSYMIVEEIKEFIHQKGFRRSILARELRNYRS
ncbi:hypothetical protein [Bacillus timonensis]|uniref:hypothetical protein n=1 Tax=Bacillus timonensis TaxID=1033734 RepID=UPI000289FEC0|nr:hypothetical protein [Bacillus timonensis]